MKQLLVSVVVKNERGTAEECTYRVAPDARYVDVVAAACARSELPGTVRCVQIMPLGGVEPHFFDRYIELLSPDDATDQRDGEEYRTRPASSITGQLTRDELKKSEG